MKKENTKTSYEKVKFITKYDKNYSIIYPTDAFGHINPRGKLTIHLYTDINSPPLATIHKVDKTGLLELNKENKESIYEDSIKDAFLVDRIIQGTVVIAPDHAMNLAMWIIDKVANHKLFNIDKSKVKDEMNKILSKEVKNEN